MRRIVRDPRTRIRDAAYEWLLLLNSGQATQEDFRAHKKWLADDPRHEDAYDRAASVWAALGEIKRNDLTASAVSFHDPHVLHRMFGGFEDRTRLFAGAFAVFCACLIGLVIFQTLPSQPGVENVEALVSQEFRTGVSEMHSVTLDDGSVVTLGASTRLKVLISNTVRQVELQSGAAIFEVATDPERPFRVEAGPISATALGTVFEVRSNGGLYRVLVDEGHVRVAEPFWINGEAMSVIHSNDLMAGDHISAEFGQRMSSPERFNEHAFGAWRQGRLEYIGATLSELVADANRYSTKPIRFDDNVSDLSATRITAFFDSSDIDALLQTLPDLYPVIIDRSGDDIFVRARS